MDALLALLQNLRKLLIDLLATFMSKSIFGIEIRVTVCLASEGNDEMGQSIFFLYLIWHSLQQDWLLGCYLCLCLSIRKLYLRLCIIGRYCFRVRIFLGWSNVNQNLSLVCDHYFRIDLLWLACICQRIEAIDYRFVYRSADGKISLRYCI